MTYPFVVDSEGYPGIAPGSSPWNDWSSRRVWIGLAGAMYQLPPAGVDGYTSTRARGRIAHGVYDGLTAVTEWAHAARSYTFSWLRLTPAQRAFVEALDSGRLVPSPWCFLPLDETNRLTEAQSYGDAGAWHSTGATPPAAAPSVTSPIPGTAPLLWTPAAAGDRLTLDLTALPATACPAVPAEPVIAAFYAWTASSTASVRTSIVARADDGTALATVDGDDITVGTTPQVVYAPCDPGALTDGWLAPELRSNDGHTVYVAAPQLTLTDEYQDWLPGTGAPRVVPITELDWTVDANLNAAGSWTLAEAVAGAL